MKRTTLIGLLIISCASPVGFADNSIAYPDGYRYWTHVKTLTLHEGHPLENPFKGIHHVYANDKGVTGIKSGDFEDGAIVVFDLLENITDNHASAEGNRILVGVMVKDQSHYSKTGGWGFEAWAGNSQSKRLTDDDGRSCFACHEAQKNHDYVFSQWRD